MKRLLSVAFGIVLASIAAAAPVPSVRKSLEAVAADPDFVEIKNGPGIQIDLRYATTDNFVHTDVYGSFHHAYLRRLGAEKLMSAVAILRHEHPGWKIRIWDALRPRSVQRIFWAHVVGTDRQKYVADPAGGSIHNFGLAVDVTLVDAQGKLLDMGTGFDDFTPAAETEHESDLLKSGRLTEAEVRNRLILRGAMTRAGFHTIPEEWWHFDALPVAQVKANYKIVE